MAEALPLSKALRDLLCVSIWVDMRKESQVPVDLGEGVGTVHVGLPHCTTGLGTLTALVVDWACGGTTDRITTNLQDIQESNRKAARSGLYL